MENTYSYELLRADKVVLYGAITSTAVLIKYELFNSALPPFNVDQTAKIRLRLLDFWTATVMSALVKMVRYIAFNDVAFDGA